MLHRYRPLLAALAAVALLAVVPPGRWAGAQGQQATITPAGASRVAPDAPSYRVNVDVKDVSDLAGFQFTLNVDPKLLKPVSVEQTPFLAGSGRQVVCNTPAIAASSISLTCVTLRRQPAGVDGAGTIAVVTLKPLAKGDSPLKLSAVKLLHPDGSPIAFTTVDSKATVGNASGWFSWWMIAPIAAVAVAVLLIVAFIVWRARRGSPPAISAEPVDVSTDSA